MAARGPRTGVLARRYLVPQQRWQQRPHERIGLWLQADAIVALTRPQFRTVGGMSVHASGRLAGQVLAGIEFRLR